MSRTRPWWVALAALAAPFGLYGTALGQWWRADDPIQLWYALRHDPWTYFIDGQVWRLEYHFANLTPWLNASYWADLMLFGLNPRAFYLHQLLAFALTLGLLWAVLRPLGARTALGALVLFAVGSPALDVATQLMNRHYIEGLCFALLTVLAHRRALATGRMGWAMAGAAAYALAVSAKEIYVPLVLILPFLGPRQWRMFAPFAAVAALYVPWRFYMLGGMGGYGSPLGADAPLFVLGGFTLPVFGMLSGGLVSLVLIAWAARRSWPLALAFAVATLLPLVPLGASVATAQRYWLLPWLGTAIAAALVMSEAKRPLLRFLFGAMVALLAGQAVIGHQQHRLALASQGAAFETAGRAFWDGGDAQTFLLLEGDLARAHWFMTGLAQLKSLAVPAAKHYRIVYDPQEAARFDWRGESLRYDDTCRCMVRAPLPQPEMRSDDTIAFETLRAADTLGWRFLTPEHAKCYVLSDRGPMFHAWGQTNRRILSASHPAAAPFLDGLPLYFFVRCNSADGSVHYSPTYWLTRGLNDGTQTFTSRAAP